MNKYFLMFFSPLLLVPSVTVIAEDENGETEVFDPSKHVRIKYNKFNTPDAVIFDVLLDEVLTNAESRTEKQLESWVFSQMNATYNSTIDAWVTSNPETVRHSRDEISSFTDLLVDVANKSFKTSEKSQKKLFCPNHKSLSFEKKLAALEQRNIDKIVDAEFFYDQTIEALDDVGRADLRAWIARIKQGYGATEYNYKTLWAGRDTELESQFSNYCESVGVVK
jgi:hypothetical protein